MRKPSEVCPADQFITVVIPTYNRPFYLEKALDTLAEYADMPYEVIVHDDGSTSEHKETVFEMSDRISTLILNNGINSGLCVSPNRCVSVAASKYILFLNDDCFFVGKCLRDICNTLSRKYIGLVAPINDIGKLEEPTNVNGTKLSVSNHLGGGSAIAFRKDVWMEVGGFEERAPSAQADNVFIYKILKAGYWKAVLEGQERMRVGNFVYGDDYKPTESFSNGSDCSLPKIFGLTWQQWLIFNRQKRLSCDWWVNGQRTIPDRHTYDNRDNPVAGLNDIPYWGQYFLDVFGGKGSHNVSDIDWTIASRHGQDKWKEEILKDSGRRI